MPAGLKSVLLRLLPWVAAMVWIAAGVLLLPRAYLEYDDAGFVYLLSHGYHAPFFSAYLSDVLIALYRFWPGGSWYAVYHYALLAISLGVVWALLRSSVQDRRWFWVLVILTGISFWSLASRITFTNTAVLLCGLSLIVLLSRLARETFGWRLLAQALGLGVMFALGWASRYEAPLSMVFLLPVVVLMLWRLRLPWRQWSLVFLVWLLPFAVASYVEEAFPRFTPEEYAHKTFLQSAARLVGIRYTWFGNTQATLAEVDWKPGYVTMVRQFAFIDEEVFSRDKINAVADESVWMIGQALREMINPSYLSQTANQYFKDVWYNQRNQSFLLVSLWLLALLLAPRVRDRVGVVLFGLFLVLSTFVMYYFVRFPERVGFPLYLCLGLSLVFYSGWLTRPDWSRLRQGWIRRLGALAAVSLLVFGVVSTFYLIAKIPKKLAEFARDAQVIAELLPEHYLFRSSSVLFYQWQDPLNTPVDTVPDAGPGWFMFSPVFYKRLEQIGLQRGSQVLPWMVDNPRAILLTRQVHQDVLLEMMPHVYGIEVEVEDLGTLPSYRESLLYRLKRVSTSPPAGLDKTPG